MIFGNDDARGWKQDIEKSLRESSFPESIRFDVQSSVVIIVCVERILLEVTEALALFQIISNLSHQTRERVWFCYGWCVCTCFLQSGGHAWFWTSHVDILGVFVKSRPYRKSSRSRNSNVVRQKLYFLSGMALSQLEASFCEASSKEYFVCWFNASFGLSSVVVSSLIRAIFLSCCKLFWMSLTRIGSWWYRGLERSIESKISRTCRRVSYIQPTQAQR